MHKFSRNWVAGGLLAALVAVPFVGMALNVGGADLIKVGTGTRKLAMMPVYDATLFVPQDLAASSERDVIAADKPMAVVIKIESRLVSAELFASSVEKGFKNSAAVGYPTDKTDQFVALFKGLEIKKGAVFQQCYDPKKGLTVLYTPPNGSTKVLGTVPGLALKKAFLATFIGPKPNTAELKRGMLGKN